MIYENVIIFGAGASFDAGIPLLTNFIETMWGYSVRGKSRYGPLSTDDKRILLEANSIRIDLERYNSRANFSTRNIEDVLSLLSFEALHDVTQLGNYETWVKAIARTVELSTILSFEDAVKNEPNQRRSVYHQFWNCLLGQNSLRKPPALVTFNYDLVFERSLWEFFRYEISNSDHFRPSGQSCGINYYLKPNNFVIRSEIGNYNRIEGRLGQPISVPTNYHKPIVDYKEKSDIEIPYLKLHGSLNWAAETQNRGDVAENELHPSNLPIETVDTPLILPPVFNKMNLKNLDSVWRKGLEILRHAKHIIIVGYSLPKTDIYMQYFLKSAVGPNSDLQRIIVFDPTLFNAGVANEEMRKRYRECFSPQFQDQIIFEPRTPNIPIPGLQTEQKPGTFYHFIGSLMHDGKLLFNP